jgi:hypothetical protein
LQHGSVPSAAFGAFQVPHFFPLRRPSSLLFLHGLTDHPVSMCPSPARRPILPVRRESGVPQDVRAQ